MGSAGSLAPPLKCPGTPTPHPNFACFSQEPLTQADLGADYAPLLDYKKLAVKVARQIAPDLQEALENKLQASLGKIQQYLQARSSRLKELELRVMLLENDNDTLNAEHKTTESKVGLLEERLEDLENRSRCKNLHAVGLLESGKYGDLQALCEAELPQALGLTQKCRIYRAHMICPDPERVNGGEWWRNLTICEADK